jgi:hypothetical protein
MFRGNWSQQLEGNMTLSRRRFLALAASAAVLPALPHLARADSKFAVMHNTALDAAMW